MSMSKKLTDEIADTLITKLNEYTSGNNPVFLSRIPKNFLSHKMYRGSNTLSLAFQELRSRYDSSEWATFKQWSDKGAKIKKGEKSTVVIYASLIKKTTPEVKDQDGKVVKAATESSIPLYKSFCVFNRDQVEGLDEEEHVEDNPDNKESDAMKYFNSSVKIVTSEDEQKFDKESITIHDRSQYKDIEEYIQSLSYYTASSIRLNLTDRKNDNRLRVIDELISEIAAGFISAFLGYNYRFSEKNLHQISGWIDFLGGNKGLVYKACSEAQKVLDRFISNHSNTKDILDIL